VNVDRLGSGVEQTEVFLHFADTGDRRLQDSLDKEAFLWVYDLIVAVFELAVDVDILDIQTGEMLEYLVIRPTLNVLLSQ
jgi:hypothetical protein